MRRGKQTEPPILYLQLVQPEGKVEAGDEIYDRKLIAALRSHAIVETVAVERKRRFAVPLWSVNLPEKVVARIGRARREGWYIVVSHEHAFGLPAELPLDLLIVHNYFPGFSFPEQRWLEIYHRVGAKKFLSRAFDRARVVVFLSQRDFRLASSDFPELGEKGLLLQPPPYPAPLLPRRMDVVHVSGSDTWLPKRLCRLTESDRCALRAANLEIADFGSDISPAFGLISDRFRVGFKLKLMQMLYAGDVIASFCDIREEVDAIMPGYPFFKHAFDVTESIQYFRYIATCYTAADIDALLHDYRAQWTVPSWEGCALHLLAALAAAGK